MSKKAKYSKNLSTVSTKETRKAEKFQQKKQTALARKNFLQFWAYPIAALIAFVVYAQTLTYDLVNFDDRVIIEQVIKDVSGVGEIGKAFSHSYSNFYRPLQNISFVFDREISANGYLGYHLSNLLIHCICVCVVILLLRKLNTGEEKSFFAGILFAVHPLFAHAVIWIPSRGDLLLTLFAMLAFWTFLKYNENHRIIYVVFHFVLMFLAAISKETAMIIPLVSLTYLVLFDIKSLKSSRFAYFVIIWAIVGAFWYLLRMSATSSMPFESSFGATAFIKNLPTAFELIGKFFLPVNLSVMATFNIFSLASGLVFLAMMISIIFVVKELSKEKKRAVVFGIVWYFLFLLPTLVFRLQQADDFFDYLEHRAYLPAIGILLVLATAVPVKWFQQKKQIFYGIASAIVVILAILTIIRSSDYSSPLNYWQAALKGNSERAFFHNNIAKTYAEKQDLDIASEHFRKSIELAPQYSMAYDGLAGIYFQKREFEKAKELMQTAISLGNATIEIYNNFGGLANTMGDYRKTIDITKESLVKFGEKPTALTHLAKAYAGIGLPDSAMIYVEKLDNQQERLKLERDVYASSTQFLLEQNRIDEAVELIQKALEIDPRFAYGYTLLANGFARNRDFANAVLNWKRALQIDPTLSQVKQQLYIYYNNVEKNLQEAEKYKN